MMRPCRVPVLALLASMLASSSASAGGKRLALMDFEGRGSSAVRTAVARSLRAEHTVLPHARLVERLAAIGRGTLCTPAEVVATASAVGADAVVCGTVSRHGRHAVLVIRIYNGGDGKLTRTLRLQLGRGGVTSETLRALRQQVGPAVAGTWTWDVVEVRSRASVGPHPDRSRAAFERNATAALPEELGNWELGDSESPGRHTGDAVIRRRGRTARAAGQHALQLGAGAAFLLRRNYRVYSPATPSAQDGQGWVTRPVAGVAVSAELFPAAWFTDGWLSHVGFGASYARYLGLTWRTADDPSERTVTHQVVNADLRIRFHLWKSQRAPDLLLRGGYRLVQFSMNDSADQRAYIPDASLSSLEAGLAVGVPIIPRWLHLSASFDYLPMLGRGEIASEREYGPATGGGMAFGGGLHGDLWGPLGWRVDVEYSWYTHEFSPESGASRHAAMARDRYLNGTVQLTFRN